MTAELSRLPIVAIIVVAMLVWLVLLGVLVTLVRRYNASRDSNRDS
jgi:hypothetical protein